MTKDEVLAGLRAGRTLACDRKDEPLLPWLMGLVADGTLESEFKQIDDQSSVIRFKVRICTITEAK